MGYAHHLAGALTSDLTPVQLHRDCAGALGGTIVSDKAGGWWLFA